MTKVGIYNQPSCQGINGVEYSALVLAEALQNLYDVEIVHHNPPLTPESAANMYGVNLKRVRLRCLDREPLTRGSRLPWRHFRDAKMWRKAVSEPYDLFISFSSGTPPFCHAPKGVLMVIFPLHAAPHLADQRTSFWVRAKKLYQQWEWEKRLKTYQLRTANSRFTQTWVERRWGVESIAVYAPIDVHYHLVEKVPMILSVGRFVGGDITTPGTSKNQLEMVDSFDEIAQLSAKGWQYLCVGPLDDVPVNRSYFDRVSHRAQSGQVNVVANLRREELKNLFEQASIFWHAAGYGVDDKKQPENTEHFGIVTVEAMAAGCVPVVINKGGQSEIVQHGINGFLWNTLEELKDYTSLLISDQKLRMKMSEAARGRALFFSRDEYVERVLGACHKAGVVDALATEHEQ